MAVTQDNEPIEERAPYKMSTIARLTDFSPILLRAWERRYKLLEPKRGPGGHRLYTEDDLNVLRRVRRLIDSGRSIGEIAGMSREALLHQHESMAVPDPEPLDGHDNLKSPPFEAPRMFRDWKERIIQAALAMDERAVGRVLDESFASVSAESVLDDLMVPSAREIGDLWMTGRCTVASEHLATGVFVHRVRKLIESAAGASPNVSLSVVATCFPEENHELGLLILSYHLVRRGISVAFLGAALPFEDLQRACRLMRPRVVLLSVTRPALYVAHKPALQEFLEQQKAECLVCLGGAGVPEEDPDIQRSEARLFPSSVGLTDAVDQLVAAIRLAQKAPTPRGSHSGRRAGK